MRNRPILRAPFDEDTIEPLVRRTRAGEPRVWRELWLAIDPVIEEIAGRFRVTSRLSSSQDERRDVVVGVMELLQANDFERLGAFLDALARRDGSGRAWLYVVTRRSASSQLREHRQNLAPGERKPRWAELLPLLDDDLEDANPVAERAIQSMDAHRIQARASRELPEAQVESLRLWLLGYENEEIAALLALAGAPAGAKLVRAAVQALRRRFLRDDEAHPPRAPPNAGLVVVEFTPRHKPLLALELGKQSGVVIATANVSLLVLAAQSAKPWGNRCINWQTTIDGGKTMVTLPTTPKGTTTIPNLTPLTTLGVRVSLTNGEGPGEWSQIVNILVQ